MRKSTLLLAVMTVALGLSTVYLHRKHAALTRTVALDREQCARQIEQLQNDYLAELAELQRYMLQ